MGGIRRSGEIYGRHSQWYRSSSRPASESLRGNSCVDSSGDRDLGVSRVDAADRHSPVVGSRAVDGAQRGRVLCSARRFLVVAKKDGPRLVGSEKADR